MDISKENKKMYDALYRFNNAESISAKRKAFREANKEKIAKVMADYYLKNKDKLKAKRLNNLTMFALVFFLF